MPSLHAMTHHFLFRPFPVISLSTFFKTISLLYLVLTGNILYVGLLVVNLLLYVGGQGFQTGIKTPLRRCKHLSRDTFCPKTRQTGNRPRRKAVAITYVSGAGKKMYIRFLENTKSKFISKRLTS